MSITTIILVLGILCLGVGSGLFLYNHFVKQKGFRFKRLVLPVFGLLMILTPSTFGWLILGIVNGFIALPQTVTIPRPSLSVSPIWVGALLIGIIASIFAITVIKRNAKDAGMSYGEYLESRMPQEDSDPVDNAQQLLHEHTPTTDQKAKSQSSSDQ